MNILFSQQANTDLEEIFDYILEYNPSAAQPVLNRIRQQIEYLRDHPHIGRPGRVPGTRELVMSGLPFIIPYQVKGNILQILRIYHTSRKWPNNF